MASENGDGSPQAETFDGVFDHVFAAPGRFQVAVEVIDPLEASALAAVDVTVIEGEVEGCDCEELSARLDRHMTESHGSEGFMQKAREKVRGR